MASNPTNISSGGHGAPVAPAGAENANQSQDPLSKDEEMIASVVAGLIPKFQGYASATRMETDQGTAAEGDSTIVSSLQTQCYWLMKYWLQASPPAHHPNRHCCRKTHSSRQSLLLSSPDWRSQAPKKLQERKKWSAV